MDLDKIKRKIERRNNRTPEQIIEHEMKKMESDRKKRLKEIKKILGINDDPNENRNSIK